MYITADAELKLRIMQFKYDLVSRKYEVLLYRIRTGELIDVRELFAMQQQKQQSKEHAEKKLLAN